jgi:hypothetical protein
MHGDGRGAIASERWHEIPDVRRRERLQIGNLTGGQPLEKLIQAILDLVRCAASSVMTDEIEERRDKIIV